MKTLTRHERDVGRLKSRGMSFVGCDKFALANAGTPVFASIITCRSATGQAHGHAAVFYERALIGVPALAFARLSHPTLFAPFRFIPTGHRVHAAPVEIVLALVDETMER